MRHLVWECDSSVVVEARILGPSCALGGLLAERSLVGRADVLVLRGSPAALECVRLAFASAPGVFAARVVRSLGAALAPSADQLSLPGV